MSLAADEPSALDELEQHFATLNAEAASEEREHQRLRLRSAETDIGNAKRILIDNRDGLRYVPGIGWLAWDGSRWRRDGDGAAMRRAKDSAHGIRQEAALLADTAGEDSDAQKKAKARFAWAMKSQSRERLNAALDLARSELALIASPERLDADPDLLTVANGTLDLASGELWDSEPGNLCTKASPVEYDPAARAPRWEHFLDEIFGGDADLIAFVQRAVGYSLTGDTSEHVLLVCYGTGCNGKSTFLEIMRELLGDFAATASFDSFVRRGGDQGPRTDLARLRGARLVTASESAIGKRLDEAVLKSLTGGDTITARFLYREEFEFIPAFKLWMATNHRPHVDGGDDAIWRRLRLIPFEQDFTDRRDTHLRTKLQREIPGILAWAMRGCLAWRREGLQMPAAVERATGDYRAEEDTLGAFLAERCASEGATPVAEFREAFDKWCRQAGEKTPGKNQIGARLKAHGVASKSSNGVRSYVGVTLK